MRNRLLHKPLWPFSLTQTKKCDLPPSRHPSLSLLPFPWLSHCLYIHKFLSPWPMPISHIPYTRPSPLQLPVIPHTPLRDLYSTVTMPLLLSGHSCAKASPIIPPQLRLLHHSCCRSSHLSSSWLLSSNSGMAVIVVHLTCTTTLPTPARSSSSVPKGVGR